MAEQTVTVRLGPSTYVAEVANELVRLGRDGNSIDVQVARAGTDPGVYRVTIEGRTRRVFVAGPPNGRWVFCEGQIFEAEVEPAGRTRTRQTAIHGDSLSAPMPATVVRIAVQPGQRVARGETLVILEAMKMEMPIRALHDGVVARITCREGDLVQPGVPLIEFT